MISLLHADSPKRNSLWFSTHPLNQDDLRPYSVEEQNSSMRLFEDVSDSRVIGYYVINSFKVE